MTPASHSTPKRHFGIGPGPIWAVLLTVLLTAQTFWLQHGKGDELFYVATALKLEKTGWDGYNLRGVDDRLVAGIFRQFELSSSPDTAGTLLAALKRSGAEYYDNPLLTQPPLLPVLIALTHRLVDGSAPYRILPFALPFPAHPWDAAANTVRQRVVRTQLYAALWPFVFGLVSVWAVYALAFELTGDRPSATWASLLVAVSPEFLLSCCKVWADTATLALVTLSLLLLFRSRRVGSPAQAAWAGALCGLAALAKTTGYIPVLVATALWLRSAAARRREPSFLPFILAAAAVSAAWYLKVASVYGDPFYVNVMAQRASAGEWFEEMARRPIGYYLINLPYQTPLLLAAAAAPFLRLGTAEHRHLGTALWAWLVAPMIVLYATKELRYLLPLYPPLAVLAGSALESARLRLDRARPAWGSLSWAVALGACIAWSASIGLTHIASGAGLIRAPF